MPDSPLQIFQDDRLYSAQDPALAQIAPESTLRFWRCRGGGPSYVKVSSGPRGRIRYSGKDLNRFVAERRVEVEIA